MLPKYQTQIQASNIGASCGVSRITTNKNYISITGDLAVKGPTLGIKTIDICLFSSDKGDNALSVKAVNIHMPMEQMPAVLDMMLFYALLGPGGASEARENSLAYYSVIHKAYRMIREIITGDVVDTTAKTTTEEAPT